MEIFQLFGLVIIVFIFGYALGRVNTKYPSIEEMKERIIQHRLREKLEANTRSEVDKELEVK